MIAGRYTLEREVGRGGMGAVWLARDEVLGRAVAVKRIGGMPGAAPDLERAEREARLAARLNHPHVVAVFDLVSEDDGRWLVMEYVEGATLAELVRTQGALTPDQAAPLLGQAADALAAAHAAGIVHRDVKPSNILVTPEGQVKLSDFGIARAEADASLTQTGLVTGSPSYLAPEVASGQQATAASDVWAIGATLFHALSGRAPYEVGDNLMGVLYRIVHEDPPRLSNAGWLGPLLESTMTRDPAHRSSMEEVRDTLKGGPSAVTRVAPAPAAVPEAGEATRTLAHAAPVAVAAAPTTDPAPAAAPARPRRTFPLLMALGVALLIGLVVWAYVATDGNDEEPPAATESPSSSGSSSSSPRDDGPEGPTAPAMQQFVSDYLATAPADPEAGFRMLTPEFQQASGGLEGYTGFWGTIETAEPIRVSADPQALTVNYLVRYTKTDGSVVEEEVGLALVQAEGTYKIAAES